MRRPHHQTPPHLIKSYLIQEARSGLLHMLVTAITILLVTALICSPAFWLVLGRLKFLKDLPKPSKVETISIIIPARNEESNLGPLLSSIQSQSCPAHEVIVVDDNSSDSTSAIARQHSANVITSAPLPEGWLGKPWACTQGARSASGNWLLFLDADTRLSSEALEHLQAAIEETSGTSVISVCPYHTVEKLYEELSAFFNLLMIAGINAFGIGKEPALFGQCLLVSQNHYDQVGGHSVVKQHILENVYLAQHLEDKNIPRRCYLGKELITMRMFPEGFRELWTSWQKGFYLGAKQANPKALLYSSVWISGAMFTIVVTLLFLLNFALPRFSASPPYILYLITYLLYSLQCAYIFRHIGSFSRIHALFFPIGLLFYQTLFFFSMIQKKRNKATEWKGRPVL